MKREKFYKYLIIFIIAATVINVSSLITILYKTKAKNTSYKIKYKKDMVHKHRSPFSPNMLRKQLDLTKEQFRLVRKYKIEYRKKAEEINRDMYNYHNESLFLITKESFDSIYADEIVQKQCLLHMKTRRESLRYLNKVKSILNKEQKENLIRFIKEISEQRYSDKKRREERERGERRERHRR